MGCVWEQTEHWLPRYARLKVGKWKGGKAVGRCPLFALLDRSRLSRIYLSRLEVDTSFGC